MFTRKEYDHGLRSAQWAELHGGGFASALAKSYYKADWGHAETLYRSFPHILAVEEFKAVEKEYSVLITLNEYRTIKAETAEQAKEIATQQYMNGKIELFSFPEFSCEECDEVKNA